MLGPDVNIARVPVDGRNYEAMGEDPYLAGEMAAAEIVGVQSQGVMATIKHWVNNNQVFNFLGINLDSLVQVVAR